jgi:hypothetical protein
MKRFDVARLIDSRQYAHFRMLRDSTICSSPYALVWYSAVYRIEGARCQGVSFIEAQYETWSCVISVAE